jgi:hypothetical protein
MGFFEERFHRVLMPLFLLTTHPPFNEKDSTVSFIQGREVFLDTNPDFIVGSSDHLILDLIGAYDFLVKSPFRQ